MNLAGIVINPRLRSTWEAIDLGIKLAKQWYLSLLLVWAIPSGIVLFALHPILNDMIWIIPFIVWWLKPLFDRLPLYIISRKLFGDSQTVGQTLKQTFSVYKFDFLAALTWRRFSFTRSFTLPITVLEKQKGKPRANRVSVLEKKQSNAATWLTIVGSHIEFILTLNLISLAYFFIPSDIQFETFMDPNADTFWYEFLYNCVYWLSLSLVAPFYVACGFSLYINRRVELEAWDIEIKFRLVKDEQDAKKERTLHALSGLSIKSMSVCLLVGLLSLNSITEIQAEPTSNEPDSTIDSPVAQSKRTITEILQSNEFIIEKTEEKWRWKPSDDEEDEEEDKELSEFEKALSELFNISGESLKAIAQVLEFILWVVVISLIIYIAYYYREQLSYIAGKVANINRAKPSPAAPPTSMMGLDVRKESLPEDIIEQCKLLWQAGNHRQALALLYRATLSKIIHEHAVKLHESFTEYECLLQTKSALSTTKYACFAHLTQRWQALAYAHKSCSDTEFNALCKAWREAFLDEG